MPSTLTAAPSSGPTGDSAGMTFPATANAMSSSVGLPVLMSNPNQRVLGSMSMRIALVSRVSGIAKIAPSGPRIQVQTRERQERDGDCQID